ncbi:YifB family Mg chelatase-like AAA ATPase [Allonocardiopsis opalescens]|uniref:Magnesium chelatase family protein n=1 Tax=Allonocardiopsis opalescens TaxID=1144618 RepID=A0A2T0PVT0_9ACTN|nr:YifB family Mg chelatase-like AAA ATPase [Allonocardiopsis opalescens]PRX95617.1 magnesium chelatase family protein [Allonocardiopsis opalescens]
MGLARTRAMALVGVDGHAVEVEAHVGNGTAGLNLVGLPDTTLREARDRIRAAVLNTGEDWPDARMTVSLSPASLPKRGSGFDLAIAVALLAADGQLPVEAVADTVFMAELALDGRTRPVRGVLPAALAAVGAGFREMVVAAENAAEARLVAELTVTEVWSLGGLLARLRGDPVPPPPPPEPRSAPRAAAPDMPPPDLADVAGQPVARRAVEVCAAGAHNLWMVGPPGTGKSMLAERLPSVLPPLEGAEALEVTKIHSIMGTLPDDRPLITTPPFCAPHHTATRAAIVGGGSRAIRPGAASQAHRGILFVDEAPEFSNGVLDALRQPLETGEVLISRATTTARLPARFLFVMAANPCPCARPVGPSGCECPPATRRRYLARLSGPLLDRIDVKVELQPVGRAELLADRAFAEPSAVVADRVGEARRRARRRLEGTPWRTNAEVPGGELRRRYAPRPDALTPLAAAMDRGQISARGVDRIVRVAWIIYWQM